MVANVTHTLYMGSYYQVQVYTDDDQDFLVDTVDEWDIGDRVGIIVKPSDMVVEKKTEQAETDGNAENAEEQPDEGEVSNEE